MWLLDTNAWIAYLNRRPSPIHQKITNMDIQTLFISEVIKAELYYGAYKSQNIMQNREKIEQLFEVVPSLEFDQEAARIAGEIRANLAKQGTPIGLYDIQIAALALRHQLILVTHNTKEFCRIPLLKLEDWQ